MSLEIEIATWQHNHVRKFVIRMVYIAIVNKREAVSLWFSSKRKVMGKEIQTAIHISIVILN